MANNKIRMTEKLRKTAERVVDLRTRRAHPNGTFDGGGRWFPDESLACCKMIREPSRAHPYSLLVHQRSLVHLAFATGYSISTLRIAARRVLQELVAVIDNEPSDVS